MVVTACGGATSKQSPPAPTAGPSFSGDRSSRWCAYANQVQGTTQLNASFEKDPKAWVSQVSALMGQAEGAAPAAIKTDVETMAGGVRSLAQALTADQYDFKKLDPHQLSALQDPHFVTAGLRVRAYDQQVCQTPN